MYEPQPIWVAVLSSPLPFRLLPPTLAFEAQGGEDHRLISVLFGAVRMMNELGSGWVNGKLESWDDLGLSGLFAVGFI